MTYDEMIGNVFANLFMISNRLQVLGDRLDDYMSVKQWLLVAVLSKQKDQAITLSKLAGQIGCSYQNAKKLAVILEKQGFVTLEKNPADARATIVSLTEQCDDYFNQRVEIETQFLQEVFSGFDQETLSGLYDAVQLLRSNIDNMEKQQKDN